MRRQNPSKHFWPILVAFLAVFPLEAKAQGGLFSYLSQYQLGFDYTSSYDSVTASYETERSGALANKDCFEVKNDVTAQRCQVSMRGGSSSGFGIVLQQAFKRQGDFYFNADIGFGARYLKGELATVDQEKQALSGLPLKSVEFSLGALIVKPYVQLGITPSAKWPDILLSIGPSVQLAAGSVSVNSKKEDVVMGTASGSGLNAVLNGFYELEIVFLRFGDGALSAFTSQDFTGSTDGTKFYPKAIDGMREIKADFSRHISGGVFGFGAKLLLNWP